MSKTKVSNKEALKILKEEFQGVTKRIIRSDLSTNPETLERLKRDIIAIHDKVVKFVAKFFNRLDDNDRPYYRNELIYIRDRTIKCFGRLSIDIDMSKSLLVPIEAQVTNNIEVELESQGDLGNEETEFLGSPNLLVTMVEITNVELLRIAAQTINRNYDGDPLALNAFLNSIDLLSDLATSAALQTFLLKFIKSKLEGKALESIPTDVNTIADIKEALRSKIKPDNSKVVAGRMLALRPDRSKMVEFTKQAEELSEALQRSLIIEGISQEKAREMTVEKAVELCRGAARSDLVKSVLASAKFDSPKEVIAKFVTEAATDAQEKQVLAFRQQKRGNNNRGSYNRGRGRNDRNYQNNSYGSNYNNYGGYNGNSYRNRGGQRGRGSDRGRRNDFNRNDYNSNWRQNRDRNVRFTENTGGPPAPQTWRAEQNFQPRQAQNPINIPYQQF